MSLEKSIFFLLHDHTKHKLWSFTIREGTILSFLKKMYYMAHQRGDILVFGYLWCSQKWLDKKKRVHLDREINAFDYQLCNKNLIM